MYVTRQACIIGKRDGQSITSYSKPACTLPSPSPTIAAMAITEEQIYVPVGI